VTKEIANIAIDEYVEEVTSAKKVLDGMIRAINAMKQKAR
jgi:hypothetical protein